ncbi:methyltransferase domain-containing protein [Amycolatopsis sp. RM579]|uniref:Methyltransferase domain-containing protein n=2 Tax=Amycolatopsis pithecellobii TaxID=664692 RepID=A0A6N7Z1D2_9PSEU|nr:methyltransferase domain-containing protein [Amycolatopsis pithecellobii]
MLNAGHELGLFRLLAERPELTAGDIAGALGVAPRSADILLLGTTALRLTVFDNGRYRNARLIDAMFADDSWEILGDLITFEDRIVYPAQADFVESLRQNRNVGLRRFPGEGTDLYHRLAEDPALEELFYRCMRSWSRLSNPVLLGKADLTGVTHVLDVGGGDGVNAIALAQRYPHVRFTVLDLPGAVEIAREKIDHSGLSDRISVCAADMFRDAFPRGHDCVLFANQLLIWSAEQNRTLLGKAWQALPAGGKVLIFSAMADSPEGPLYAALDNAYFATLPAENSTIYRWDEYEKWLVDTGFREVRHLPGDTWTPHAVISAIR